MAQLSTEERVNRIASIAEGGGDIVGLDELSTLLESGKKLYTYDGFEPSGQMHISQGIMRAINVNKMITAGFTFRMWVADWFGYLNNKMGGDLEKIKTVGKYFIEIWKACGMDLEHTEFLWTSDAVKDDKYWEVVMKVAKSITLKRAIRTTQIMGRNESDDLSAGMIFYPCMQVTDIFHVMEARVTQLGLDQQKANILAREVGEELGYWKPIIVSHGMLQGLQPPVEKKRTRYIIGEERIQDDRVYLYNGLAIEVLKISEEGLLIRTSGDNEKLLLENEEYCSGNIVFLFSDVGGIKTLSIKDNNKNALEITTFKFLNKVKLQRLLGGSSVIIYTKNSLVWKLESISDSKVVISISSQENLLRTVYLEKGQTDKYFDVDIGFSGDILEQQILIQDNTDERKLSMKMSKSMPDSSIFMTDTPEQVTQKIRKAYCPEGVVEDNPILAYCKYIIFNAHFLKREKVLLENGIFVVKRPEKFGGDVSFASYDELEKAYVEKTLYPLDLKNAVVAYLNELIRPVREHFENNAEAKVLLEKVQSYQTTR